MNDIPSILLAAVIGVVLASAVDYGLDVRERLTVTERLYQEALCWSDEYQRQLLRTQAQLAEVKQNYAVLLWLHDGTTMLEQSAAWLAGLHLVKK